MRKRWEMSENKEMLLENKGDVCQEKAKR